MERETFVGIDVGTTKVVALIGEVGRDGALTIIGKGIVPASGLRKGIVVSSTSTRPDSGVRSGAIIAALSFIDRSQAVP